MTDKRKAKGADGEKSFGRRVGAEGAIHSTRHADQKTKQVVGSPPSSAPCGCAWCEGHACGEIKLRKTLLAKLQDAMDKCGTRLFEPHIRGIPREEQRSMDERNGLMWAMNIVEAEAKESGCHAEETTDYCICGRTITTKCSCKKFNPVILVSEVRQAIDEEMNKIPTNAEDIDEADLVRSDVLHELKRKLGV